MARYERDPRTAAGPLGPDGLPAKVTMALGPDGKFRPVLPDRRVVAETEAAPEAVHPDPRSLLERNVPPYGAV